MAKKKETTKKKIEVVRPKYFDKAVAACACGQKYTIGSTVEKIEVELCSNCHPFYTGKQNLIDSAGKVEKFKARREKAASDPKKKKSEKKARRAIAKK